MLTPADIEKRIQEKHPFITIDPASYTKTTKPCRFFDSEFGEWWTRPSHVMRGSVHPSRAGNKKYTAEEVERKIQSTRPFIKLDHTTFKNTNSITRFFDSDYGWWETTAIYLLLHETARHPKHAGRQALTPQEVEFTIQKTRPHITLDYSTYKNTQTKATFKDNLTGVSWQARPNCLLYKGYKRPLVLLTPQSVEQKIQKTRPHITLDYNSYCGANKKAVFIDRDFGAWETSVALMIYRTTEHPRRRQSTLETFVEKNFAVCMHKKRICGHTPDFIIIDNTFLEVDGLYYHSSKIKQDIWYHFKKRQMFEKSGCKVLQLREHEIIKRKEQCVALIERIHGKARTLSVSHLKVVNTPLCFFNYHSLYTPGNNFSIIGLSDGADIYAALATDGKKAYYLRKKWLHR